MSFQPTFFILSQGPCPDCPLLDKRDYHSVFVIEIANRSSTASLNFFLHPM